MPILALCVYFFNQEIVAKPVASENSKPESVINPLDLEKRVPTNDQLKKWASETFYIIEIDNIRVSNNFLNTKDSANFSYFAVNTTESRKTGYIQNKIIKLMTTEYYESNKFIHSSQVVEQIQEQPTLKVNISGETVTINGKETTAKNFAETIDKITAKWTEKEIMSYSIHLQSDNGVDKFVGKLASAFHNTRLYKTNPSKELIPPPPPPAPNLPKVGKVAPPPPAPAEKETKTLYLNIRENQVLLNDKEIKVADFAKSLNNITKDWNPTEFKNARVWIKMENPDNNIMEQLEEEYKKTRLYEAQPDHGLIPPPPPAPAPPELSTIAPSMPPTPPLPPTPPSPEKMIEEMTAAKATFYYNGDKITAEKAKKLFKTKDNLSFMATEAKNGNKPMVLITDN